MTSSVIFRKWLVREGGREREHWCVGLLDGYVGNEGVGLSMG
jgi:hypothetical protein